MLTPEQIQTLQTAVNRIIPADDFPSGWDAGVGEYLARQLSGDLRSLQDMYRAGLDALDAEGRAEAGTAFASLDPSAQDAILARLEAGKILTNWPVDPARFFTHLVEHTMEGYYSDPGNGGNRDAVSWAMIGFVVRG